MRLLRIGLKRALDPHGDDGNASQANILLHKTLMTGRFDDYFDWARNHLAKNPLDTDGLFDLAAFQQAAGLMDASAATSRKLLELSPAYATATAQYAQALLLMGEKSEALSAADKESDPASKQAHSAGLCVLGYGSASRIRCGPRRD